MSKDEVSNSAYEAERDLKRRKKPNGPIYLPDWLVQREVAEHVKIALQRVGGKVLDVGCGGKPYMFYRHQGITQWIGFDVPENKDADVHGYAHELPFSDGSFDAVLLTEVLEHVSDPPRVIKEVARVLRPGGTLILTVPMYFQLHEEPYDFQRFTIHGLRHLLSGAGLRITEVRRMATGLKVAALAANLTLWNFGERLPLGKTMPGRLLWVPFYLFNNIVATALSVVIQDERNVTDFGLVALRES